MSTDNPIGTEKVAAAFDAAEDIRDPLDGLVEKTAIAHGAPFAPDVLERLAAIKKTDRAAFETLRAQLKEAGCRSTQLDNAIAEENGDKGGRGRKQADILLPVPGGSVETLRSFLNVQSDNDFVLVVASALAVLRDRGPYLGCRSCDHPAGGVMSTSGCSRFGAPGGGELLWRVCDRSRAMVLASEGARRPWD